MMVGYARRWKVYTNVQQHQQQNRNDKEENVKEKKRKMETRKKIVI